MKSGTSPKLAADHIGSVILKGNLEPLLAEIAQNVPRLHLRVNYLSRAFEEVYPELKELLERGEYKNVLFNLDQCGHSKVDMATITDIIASFASAEIFYTFGITSILKFYKSLIRVLAGRLIL
jgi:three-Cys-motif partner protein